ncbi:MAG: YbaB/EbfC family nucleoid-associated protein [Acidimicrobiales bacterium]
MSTDQPGDDDKGGLALPGEDAGGFELPDIQGLLAQAQQVQEQLMAAQAAAAEQVFTGHAGGGVVLVELTGAMEVQAIRIAPEVVDPADVEMLEDLVLAAFRDAVAQVNAAQQASLGGLGLGGAGEGGLGGLLGG